MAEPAIIDWRFFNLRLPTRTARLVCLTILYALLVQPAYAQKPRPARTPATERSTLVERVGPNGFVQVEADSFTDLSDRQKMLAYWLSQASIAIDPIIYDQMSRFGLQQKRILDAIVSNPRGINPSVMKKITEFTKLFWANRSIARAGRTEVCQPDSMRTISRRRSAFSRRRASMRSLDRRRCLTISFAFIARARCRTGCALARVGCRTIRPLISPTAS